METDMPMAPERWWNEERVSASEWHREVAGGQERAHMRPSRLRSQEQSDGEGCVDAREEEPGIAGARDREGIEAKPQTACGEMVTQAERLSIVNIVWVAGWIVNRAGNDLGRNYDLVEHNRVEKAVQHRVGCPDNRSAEQHPVKRGTLAITEESRNEGVESPSLRRGVVPPTTHALHARGVGLLCSAERRFVPGQVGIGVDDGDDITDGVWRLRASRCGETTPVYS